MRKLFDLNECSESEPMDPGPGSSAEEWYGYFTSWGSWLNSCIMELGRVPMGPPPPNPNDDPNLFEDSKGFVWARNITAKAVEFKLDLFNTPGHTKTPALSGSDNVLIVGFRISPGDYTVMTLGADGIRKQTISRAKVRFKSLLKAVSDHTKLPNKDMDKMPADVLTK